MDYQLQVLDNGLRVAVKTVQSTKVVHSGFVINAGSRNDNVSGAAHCLEHMFFKGTKNRSNLKVLNCLEEVGGELNAFTTKEYTAVYASVLDNHFKKAVDVLCDVICNSTFPETELKKERKVILEEIAMYQDTPEENIYDEFQEVLFAGHPLAHNILGDTNSVANISRNDLNEFYENNYHFENMVFVAVGDIDLAETIKLLEKYLVLNTFKKPEIRKSLKLTKSARFNKKVETEFAQGHLLIGTRAYEEGHNLRWPLLLVNNYFGGPGMNSILNIILREKHGLAYQVESGYQAYTETGMFHCYIGCEKKNIEKALNLMEIEIKKIREKGMSDAAILKAKNQFCGQIAMADENRSGVMIHIGRGILKHGRANSLEEVLNRIKNISKDQINQAITETLNFDNFNMMVYG